MRQATGSTRIHLNSKKKKISKSSENYNELLEKRKKKVKEKTELGPLLIFFLGIVLAGLTYYIQFYKPIYLYHHKNQTQDNIQTLRYLLSK